MSADSYVLPADIVARWIDHMIDAGRVSAKRSKGECADALGVTGTTMSDMLRRGVNGPTAKRTALAMRAALVGEEPFR